MTYVCLSIFAVSHSFSNLLASTIAVLEHFWYAIVGEVVWRAIAVGNVIVS